MLSIVADINIPFLKGALEPWASVRYLEGRDIDHQSIEHADALLVRTRTLCNKELLHHSRVKFIASATIGADHIDTSYCESHGIKWKNAPGCNAASVQQYIASVLASLVIRRQYQLKGKTIGIIGVGHVGGKIELLAKSLGMKVLLNDPPRARMEGPSGFVSLEELLPLSDIITLHVPLTRTAEDPTFQLLNATAFGLIKHGAILINTARGEVLDHAALGSVIDRGKLSAVVLDVWENEPMIDRQLLNKTAIATPHIAGYSMDGKMNGTMQVVRSLGAFFNLPLTGWMPSGIPPPLYPEIIVEGSLLSLETTIATAILRTYDVMEDDARFRANPADFEKLRNAYPVRREFPAYRLRLLQDSIPAKSVFQSLGFRLPLFVNSP